MISITLGDWSTTNVWTAEGSALVLMAMVTAGQAQKKALLEDLSWLSGCWEGRQGNAILEEIWSKPAGGSMLGLGRTSEGESHCFLRVHAVSGRKRKSGLFAAIAGRPPAFPLRLRIPLEEK